MLFDLLKSKKRKEEIFKKHLDDFFNYFNNQHTSFLNIFTSKFSQINFFGKNLNFNKNTSFEKYFLLDLFNNQYSKSKNKFLCLLYDILKDKNNNSNNKNFKTKILQAKLNENKINKSNDQELKKNNNSNANKNDNNKINKNENTEIMVFWYIFISFIMFFALIYFFFFIGFANKSSNILASEYGKTLF